MSSPLLQHREINSKPLASFCREIGKLLICNELCYASLYHKPTIAPAFPQRVAFSLSNSAWKRCLLRRRRAWVPAGCGWTTARQKPSWRNSVDTRQERAASKSKSLRMWIGQSLRSWSGTRSLITGFATRMDIPSEAIRPPTGPRPKAKWRINGGSGQLHRVARSARHELRTVSG